MAPACARQHMREAQSGNHFGSRERKHVRCARVCVHAACLLWQPLLFALERLEGGAGDGEVTRGEKEASAAPERRPGEAKSWD